MKTNFERANHGSKENQDTRIAHQILQLEMRDKQKRVEKPKYFVEQRVTTS